MTQQMTDAARGIDRSRTEWLLAGGILATSLLLCLPALKLLSIVWRSTEFYSHGYLIPLVAAYLLFRSRDEIGQALRTSRPPALGPLIAFGVAASRS